MRIRPRAEKRGVDAVSNDAHIKAGEEGLPHPRRQPLRRRADNHVLSQQKRALFAPHLRREVEKERFGIFAQRRAMAAACLPARADVCKAALSRIGKFTVKGVYQRYTMSCEILKKRLDINEICMRLMQVDNVGLEFVHKAQQTPRGEEGEAARQPCDTGERRVQRRLPPQAELEDILFIDIRAAAIAHRCLAAVFIHGGIKGVNYLAGAAAFAHGIYIQNSHLVTCNANISTFSTPFYRRRPCTTVSAGRPWKRRFPPHSPARALRYRRSYSC